MARERRRRMGLWESMITRRVRRSRISERVPRLDRGGVRNCYVVMRVEWIEKAMNSGVPSGRGAGLSRMKETR